MRNISFALTTDQFRRRTKTVTRRLGWNNLKPGDILMGVEKAQGLKKGRKVVRLGKIRVVSFSKVKLCNITYDDVCKEGFKGWKPQEFIEMFCRHNRVPEDAIVNRIEFEYINDPLDR